jgi:hypothetical protein
VRSKGRLPRPLTTTCTGWAAPLMAWSRTNNLRLSAEALRHLLARQTVTVRAFASDLRTDAMSTITVVPEKQPTRVQARLSVWLRGLELEPQASRPKQAMTSSTAIRTVDLISGA